MCMCSLNVEMAEQVKEHTKHKGHPFATVLLSLAVTLVFFGTILQKKSLATPKLP